MQKFCTHVELHCKTIDRAVVALRLAGRARSVLLVSTGVGNVQTDYRLYLIYDSTAALPHTVVSNG